MKKILLFLFLLVCVGVEAQNLQLQYTDNVDTLIRLNPNNINNSVFLKGWLTNTIVGGGVMRWFSGDVTATNTETVVASIHASAGVGRWKRITLNISLPEREPAEIRIPAWLTNSYQWLSLGSGFSVSTNNVLENAGGGGGSGSVTNSGTSTHNALARFFGASGQVITNSAVLLDDSGNLSGINSLVVTNGGLRVLDTDNSNYLSINSAEDLTNNRILSLTLGNVNRSLIFTADASLGGVNTGDQTITLTGAVTGSGTGSFATTIPDASITYAKIQNLSTNVILGRGTTTGPPIELQVGSGLAITNNNTIYSTATAVGGSDTFIQFNNVGTFAGADGATWDNTNKIMTVWNLNVVSNLYGLGSFLIATNRGAHTFLDTLVDSGSPGETEESVIFGLDGNPVFKLYSQSDGIGGVTNLYLIGNASGLTNLSLQVVRSLSELQSLSPIENRFVMYVDGIADGIFYVTNTVSGTNHTSTAPGTRASSTTAGLSWQRVYSGPVYASWWGETSDGVTDDSVAINAAIDTVQNISTVILGNGTQRLANPILINRSDVTLRGQGNRQTGNNGSHLKPDVGVDAILIASSANTQGTRIENLMISPAAASTNAGIVIGNATPQFYTAYTKLDRLFITGFTGVNGGAVKIITAQELDIDNCRLQGNYNNVHFRDPVAWETDGFLTSIHIHGMAGYIGLASNCGILLEGRPAAFTVSDIVIESNGTNAFRYPGTAASGPSNPQFNILNCHIEANSVGTTNPVIYIHGGASASASVKVNIKNNFFYELNKTVLDLDRIFSSTISGNSGLWQGTTPVVTTANVDMTVMEDRSNPDDSVSTWTSLLPGSITVLERGKLNLPLSIGIGTSASDNVMEVNMGTNGQIKWSYDDSDGSPAVEASWRLWTNGVTHLIMTGVPTFRVSGSSLFTGGAADPGDGTPVGTRIGFNTVSGHGFIQAAETAVAYYPLSVQPLGGVTGIGKIPIVGVGESKLQTPSLTVDLVSSLNYVEVASQLSVTGTGYIPQLFGGFDGQTLTTDDTVVTVSGTVWELNSDDVTAANRTFLLSDPSNFELGNSMRVTLVWGMDAGELLDGSTTGDTTVFLSEDWRPASGDTLLLEYINDGVNGGDWYELSRSPITATGGTSVFVNGASVANPNFADSASALFSVVGTNVSVTATGGGNTQPLVADYTTKTSTTGVDADINSYTIAANTVNVDGAKLRFYVSGLFNTHVDGQNVEIRFQGQTLIIGGGGGGVYDQWVAFGEIVRVTNNTWKASATIVQKLVGGTITGQYTELTEHSSADWTVGQPFAIYADVGANGNVTQSTCFVDYILPTAGSITEGMSLANPSATVNGTAVNGAASSAMRSDGAPALANPFTPASGTQTNIGGLNVTTVGNFGSVTVATNQFIGLTSDGSGRGLIVHDAFGIRIRGGSVDKDAELDFVNVDLSSARFTFAGSGSSTGWPTDSLNLNIPNGDFILRNAGTVLATFNNATGGLSVTSGVGSTAVDAAVTIDSSGWTNTFGKNANVFLEFTNAVWTVYNNAGTAVFTNSLTVGPFILTVPLQVSGKIIVTTGGVSGRAVPF